MAAGRRALAGGLGLAYLLENALVAFVFVFLATFPFENWIHKSGREAPGSSPSGSCSSQWR
jgi:hypothetical protein